LLLHLIFWDDLLQRLSGGPDWFIPINTAVGLLPLSDAFFWLLVITGGVSLLRLILQLFQRQAGGLAFTLRAITAGSALIAVLLLLGIRTTRPAAWQAYDRAVIAALDQLRPGQTPAQAEARLEALHPAERDRRQFAELPGTIHSFGRNYNLGGLDAYASRTLRLHYGRDGRLQRWDYQQAVFIDGPQECKILKEYPAKGSYPKPCPDSNAGLG
ncbi:MAG: hypothetical protein ACAI44_27780, partial [Candidatus Sericytochromatia bacterium]